jgi:hypothetical protein
MAGFSVVEHPLRTIWAPVDYNSTTLYVGQLVVSGATASTYGAVKAWNPAGAGDTTADQVPFGVVVGTNNKEPLFSSTYNAEYITGVQSQANLLARKYFGQEGMYGKNDPQAMVQVAVLGVDTVLKGRIFNTSYGTSISYVTVSTGSTTGAGFTSDAANHTPVAANATVYCRTGANKGLYRVTYDTSSTVRTVYHYFPYDIAVGDTFKAVNISTLGTCKMMTDTSGTFIDNAAAVGTTNWIWIDVLDLNLETDGQEYAIFRINPLQFLSVRA